MGIFATTVVTHLSLAHELCPRRKLQSISKRILEIITNILLMGSWKLQQITLELENSGHPALCPRQNTTTLQKTDPSKKIQSMPFILCLSETCPSSFQLSTFF